LNLRWVIPAEGRIGQTVKMPVFTVDSRVHGFYVCDYKLEEEL